MTQDQINELAEVYRAALDEPHHGPCVMCERKEQMFRVRLAALSEPEGEVYAVEDRFSPLGIRQRVIPVPPQEFAVGQLVRVVLVDGGAV